IVGAEVTLTRNHDLIESEVQVAVAGGTATAGLDFTNPFPSVVTFDVGETTQTISIPVLEDDLQEGTETIDLSLTAISNADLGDQNTATVNILDNFVPPVAPPPVAPPVGLNIVGTGNNDNLSGAGAGDTVRGRGGNDRLRGLAGDDLLIGGRGNDRLVGGNGDDNLRGNGGDDRLNGGRGNDNLRGNGGDDRLNGRGGDDLLNGGNGGDRLSGGGGDDELIGGGGDDTLIGGSGDDIFTLKRRQGTDFIRDFNIGEDVIRLQGSLSFRDLSFDQQGNNTLIEAGNETLATLRGIQADQLSRASFV
ncbi:MAG: Calx-beta domain-containing protein, partial [Elainellaceae cyanobacterium]